MHYFGVKTLSATVSPPLMQQGYGARCLDAWEDSPEGGCQKGAYNGCDHAAEHQICRCAAAKLPEVLSQGSPGVCQCAAPELVTLCSASESPCYCAGSVTESPQAERRVIGFCICTPLWTIAR